MRHSLTRFAVLFLLGVWLAPGPCAALAAGAEGGRQCRTLVYTANPSYPPYHWAVGENQFDGASIELLKLVAPAGLTLKPAVYPWKRALQLARQGEIDLIVSLRNTPERNEYLLFTSHRAFPNPIVVFVRKDRVFPYKGWQDLKGRRGGMSRGDTFGGGFDEFLRQELTVSESKDMESNFAMLEAGRIDWFVTSRYAGAAYAATHRMAHGFVSLSPAISEQDIHFGFSRASPCAALADEMSRKLHELDRKGVLQRLLQKHLRRFEEGSVVLPN